jgi:hypothetical protein
VVGIHVDSGEEYRTAGSNQDAGHGLKMRKRFNWEECGVDPF